MELTEEQLKNRGECLKEIEAVLEKHGMRMVVDHPVISIVEK